MSLKKIFPIFIILLTFVLAIFLYPTVPEIMVTHWGAYGEPNGYSGKFFALFFIPTLSVFFYLLFRFLPKTDPYHSHFKEFESYFDTFINIIFVFFTYLYLGTMYWNLIAKFNLLQFLSPAFALLTYYIGVLCSVAKRNWFVGIRTPWTMSSDYIWQKTHRLGAILFKLTAFISLLGIIWPNLSIYFIMIPILLFSAFLFLYSYVIFRQEKN